MNYFLVMVRLTKSLGAACLCTSCGSAYLPVVREIGRAGQEECRRTLAQCRQ